MSTTYREKFNPKSICLPQLTRSGIQQKRWVRFIKLEYTRTESITNMRDNIEIIESMA